MFGRVLLFVLCLAAQVYAIDYDTLFYGNIEDAQISWDDDATQYSVSRRNYGGATGITIFEGSDRKSRAWFRFSSAGLAQVPDTNKVIGAKLYVKTTFASLPYYLKVYGVPNDQNCVEGSLTGSALNYGHPGMTWFSPNQPAYPDTATGTLPSRFDWRDSNFVSTIKNQGSWGACWAFAVLAQVESAMKKIATYTVTVNSEDGTGADQVNAPMLTPSPEVTATGWEARPIPAWLLNKWYRTTGFDNGFIFTPDSGNVRINTTENASNKPRIFINCTTIDKTTGLVTENTAQITGTTNLFDTQISAANPTTNYGTLDTAIINSTNFYLLRVDSLRNVLNTFFDGVNDTVGEFLSATCSLYIGAKYSNASVRAHQLLKSKFVEGEATYNVWKTNYEWGTAGALKYDQLDLSEQQFVTCVPGTDTANGGSPESAIDYFMVDSMLTERAFPYKVPGTFFCPDTFGDAYATIIKWAWRIPVATERALKQAILIQPLTGVHQVNSSFNGYVYSTSNTCWWSNTGTIGDHAIELIGWDDTDSCDSDGGVGTWLIKNQYGAGWGQDGFAYVSKNDYTNFTNTLSTNSTSAPLVISMTATVPRWSSDGMGTGVELTASPVSQTSTVPASSWVAIDIPAWVVRAMINGNYSRSLLIEAESESTTGLTGGVIFTSTEGATTADRPYLVLTSIPQSQVNTKIGNAAIGNSKIGAQ